METYSQHFRFIIHSISKTEHISTSYNILLIEKHERNISFNVRKESVLIIYQNINQLKANQYSSFINLQSVKITVVMCLTVV